MMDTKIQWCHHTFNPWRGCTKVSAGCAHCYAETLSKRNPSVLGTWGHNGTRAIAAESYWRQPATWDRAARKANESRRVFCASLGDVFEDRPDLVGPRERLFDVISMTGNLDWLLLTKRPENIARLWPETILDQGDSRVWLGVSVEDQATADERIPILLSTPAAVRFVSYEPALGPVDLWGARYPCQDGGMAGAVSIWQGDRRLDWVIVGGESGPGARPCDVAWIRDIIAQCKAAKVPVFVKQLGAVPSDGWTCASGQRCTHPDCGRRVVHLSDRKGGDMSEWPEDLRVREFPEVRA